MKVVRAAAELRGYREETRRRGDTLALVPTMGYLHEGHLSLVDRGHELADQTVMTLFVNPTQFGPDEDLDAYPRDFERDRALAEGRGVDCLFAPPVEEVYPEGDPVVTIDPGPLGDRLCGAYRPGHFRGVLTVVSKLFGLTTPDVAIFGQKDYQQLALVREMVRTLRMPVRIEGAPIVREPDGLALSSRNKYLSEDERKVAPGLFRGLLAAREAFREGARDPEVLTEVFRGVAGGAGFAVQYAEVVAPDDLSKRTEVHRGDVLLVAAHLGETRLIDNLILD